MNRAGRKIIIEGVEYDSIKACCDSLGISMSTLNAKRRCGINLEDAINICLTGLNKGKGIIYNGVQYPSIRRCCLLNNISYDDFIHFMKYNLNKQSSINIQDALDLYLSSHSIVYRGVKYSSKRECAEAFGTSMQVINRVKIRNSYNKGV